MKVLTTVCGYGYAFLLSGVGANQVLAALREICDSKGATVCGVGDVRWFSLHRERQIAQVVEALSGLF